MRTHPSHLQGSVSENTGKQNDQAQQEQSAPSSAPARTAGANTVRKMQTPIGGRTQHGVAPRAFFALSVMSKISRVASQPDQDSSIDAELWTFGGLVVMLYTAVIVLITAIACWVAMRTPDPPDGPPRKSRVRC